MKLVINIDKEIFDLYKIGSDWLGSYEDKNEMLNAIKNGTSLDEILDNIRTEIEEQKKERCFDDDDMFAYKTGLDDALYIIDKHKAESEE